MSNIRKETILKCENDVFEDVPPYAMIEGFRINKAWMDDKDYPEPPDEPEQPTEESKKVWDMYRKALDHFSSVKLNEYRNLKS